MRTARIVAMVALLGGGAATIGGCSETDNNGSEVTSTGGVALQLGPGVVVDSLSYAITGRGGFNKTGTLDVSHSTTVSGTITGLVGGTGYAITANGTSTDGSVTCAGSASFNVAPRQVTAVALHLICHQAPTIGSISVNGTINVCPVVDGIAVDPGQAAVGGAVTVTATAHDLDAGPSPLTYSWTATAGTFSAPTGSASTFTCAAAGTATLTLAASDGDPAAGCADHLSVTVTCTGP